MEQTGFLALDAPQSQVAHAELGTMNSSFAFPSLCGDRGSEARRFLFAASDIRAAEKASLGSFPGKFAWIAVALFILSVLIAVVG